LVPFLALVLFLAALSWLDVFLTRFPDQYGLSNLVEFDEGKQVMMFIMAFPLASGLLVPERDERTLAFLDALPVGRAQVFGAKFLPALAVLWLLPLSDLLFRKATYAWSRTLLEAHFRWRILATGALLDAASCFVYLSLGLALSYLRRFSLLVLGVMIAAYLFLQELHVPFVPLLHVFTLGDPVFQGQRWLIPGTKLAVQLAWATVCAALAFGAFLVMGDTTGRLADRVRRRRGAALLAGFGTALVVHVWLGLFIYWSKKQGAERRAEFHYAQWPTARANTARYHVLYPENQVRLVNSLLDRADSAEARVRAFLRADPIPQIVADLTGSEPHTAGQAHWKKVRIDLLAAGRDLDSLTAVLAHETTHVYIDHQSKEWVSEHFNSTRFFHEGLASYVEYHLFQPTNKLIALRRVAAVMRARREVKIEELLDDHVLARLRDHDLVYPLGEVFVAALIQRRGDAAPGRIIKAFARPNAPTGLDGFSLWQDIFQACGYNFSEVGDAFFAELEP
jgi:hypothetical protein